MASVNYNSGDVNIPNIDNFYIETVKSEGTEQRIIKFREGTAAKSEGVFASIFGSCTEDTVAPQQNERELKNLIIKLLKGEKLKDISLDQKAFVVAQKLFSKELTPLTTTPITSTPPKTTPLSDHHNLLPGTVASENYTAAAASIAQTQSSTAAASNLIHVTRPPDADIKKGIELIANKAMEETAQREKLTPEQESTLMARYKRVQINNLSENFYTSIDSRTASELLKGKPGAWLLRFDTRLRETVVCFNDGTGRTREIPVEDMTWEQIQKNYGLEKLVTPSSANMTHKVNVSRSMHRKASRGLKLFKKLHSGVSKGAKVLKNRYISEAIDPKHRYGNSMFELFTAWKANKGIKEGFSEWVERLEKEGTSAPGATEKLVKLAKETSSVTYLDPEQRKEYLLRVSSGNRITNKHIGPNFSTLNRRIHPQIFVMDQNNKIYFGTYHNGRFHHTSFLSGGATKGSGEFYLENGILTNITSKSGHYWPNEEMIIATLEALQKEGIDLSKVQFTLVTKEDPKVEYTSAAEYLQAVKKAEANPVDNRPKTKSWTVYNVGFKFMEKLLTQNLANDNYYLLRAGQNVLQKDVLVFCYKNDSGNYVEINIRKESDGTISTQMAHPYVGQRIIMDESSVDAVIESLADEENLSAPPNEKPHSDILPIHDIDSRQAHEMLLKDSNPNFLIRNDENRKDSDFVILCRIDPLTKKYEEIYLTIELGMLVSQTQNGERTVEQAPDLDSFIASLLKQNKLK